jgi:hypothetical protein
MGAIWAGQAGGDSKSIALPPIQELAAAAEATSDDLAALLANAQTYAKTKDRARPAYMLALLANAVAEAEGSVRWKEAALQVRDAALRLALCEERHDEATKIHNEIKNLLAGGASNGSPPKLMNWAEISPIKYIMIEVNVRSRPLTKMVRTPAQFQKEVDKVQRNAMLLGLLGRVSALYPKPKDAKGSDEELQKWYVAMCDAAAALSKEAKAGNQAAAKSALASLRKSCTDCHEKFRPNAVDDDQ